MSHPYRLAKLVAGKKDVPISDFTCLSQCFLCFLDDYPYDVINNRREQEVPVNSYTPNMQRRDPTELMRMNSVGAGRLPQQSTSFDSEDPFQGNMSRVPRHPPYQNSLFGGAQSPRPFRYPGSVEDNAKYIEMNVTLQRQESGFGFRVIGGTEDRTQVRFECLNLL